MKKFFSQLDMCGLFDGIAPEDIDSMLSCLKAKIIRYKKGSAVFLEGDPAGNVGIVLSGKVHIVREDYYGNRNIVAIVSTGEMFGEVFACAGTDLMPVSVFAEEISEIMFIDLRSITTTCGQGCEFHGVIIRNLLRIVSEKNLILNRKIDFLSKRSTREKLLSYLSAQAKRTGSAEFSIPFNRQELADFLCVDRSAMFAELSKMSRDGLIRYEKSRFRLL